jgi:hypothetical protein
LPGPKQALAAGMIDNRSTTAQKVIAGLWIETEDRVSAANLLRTHKLYIAHRSRRFSTEFGIKSHPILTSSRFTLIKR